MTGIRVVHQNAMDHHHTSTDAKSVGSYRSTQTTRSSVLERAREYNRRLDQQKQGRSKSAERSQSEYAHSEVSAASEAPRSQSAGRMGSTADNNNAVQGNRISTRERALASVQRESLGAGAKKTGESRSHNNISSNNTYNSASHRAASPVTVDTTHSHHSVAQATPRSNGSASAYSSHVSRPKPTTPRMAANDYGPTNKSRRSSSAARHNTPHHLHSQSHTHSFDSYGVDRPDNQNNANNKNANASANNYEKRIAPSPRDSPSRTMQSSPANNTNNITNNEEHNHEAVVTPELLVDALSGHEDGLLAIAEKLMEHYDSGYDVMGEAIIDAFADVQKLFQHVVEAAHMEGAAFEASRREEEMAELRQQAAAAGASNGDAFGPNSPGQQEIANAANGAAAAGPTRHDEFIDQDVKDILNEAIRKGSNYRNNNKFTECYQLYEQASQNASSLLPVDSDHRGRLQLSIARAESMSHERACAILRYAMDDVLRSGLRAGSVPLPDPSKRADVVLNRPKGGHAAMTGSTGVQSSEEALNSLVEEMREVMNAPVYNNTPLQSVATRFLAALADAQKAQQKNEEKLEQNLAKLKGDFLLARAEWEEKLNSTVETAEVYKEKYHKLKDSIKPSGGSGGSVETGGGSTYLDHARSALASQQQRVGSGTLDEDDATYGYSIRSSASRTGSQVSLGSGLANHARNIVGSFACAGNNMRSGGVVAQEMAENRDAEIREMAFRRDPGMRDRRRQSDKRNSGSGISMSYSDRSDTHSQSTTGQRRTPHSVASGSTRSKSSRSFREYSRSPQRVDF